MSKPIQDNICEERLYEHFYKTHAKALRNYLCIKFGTIDLAEDLMQEAFIKLWDNCFKVSVDKAKSFLYTTATNLGISQKRHDKVKFKHQSLFIQEYEISTNESPEFLLLEKEFKDKFTQIIASLPDRQREVFLLSRVEKKTYKEIAILSNVSVKAIEKLMHKALLKVREALGGIKI